MNSASPPDLRQIFWSGFAPKCLVGRCRVGHGRVSAAGGRKPLSRPLHPSRTRHRPFPSNSIRWASERPRRSSHHTMSTPRRGPRGSVGALIEEVRFARDSPVEGDGFEPSVPRKRDPLFKSAHQSQRAVHNELCDRRNDQVLDAARFKQGDGAIEAGFGGIAPKNCWK